MTCELCWMFDQNDGEPNVPEFVLRSELCKNIWLVLYDWCSCSHDL